MASRDIKVNLEALRTLVEENATTAALNVDDEGVQLVEQIGLLCMSDAGLQELSKELLFLRLSMDMYLCKIPLLFPLTDVIVPSLVQEESSSLCSVLESAAAPQVLFQEAHVLVVVGRECAPLGKTKWVNSFSDVPKMILYV